MTLEHEGRPFIFEIKNSLCARRIGYFGKYEGGKFDCSVCWCWTNSLAGPLNAIEKSMAYGFSLKTEKGKTLMKLTSLKNRPVELIQEGGSVIPLLTISGRECVLERVWVEATETIIKIPKVHYVDVHGRDRRTGEAVTERIPN